MDWPKLVVKPGMLAVLRVLAGTDEPLSIRAIAQHAGLSVSATHGVIRRLAAGSAVRLERTRRETWVHRAHPIPAWIGRIQPQAKPAWVVRSRGLTPFTVLRRTDRRIAKGPTVYMAHVPPDPSHEDTWVALLAHDPAAAARAFSSKLDRTRLRRRIHEEGLAGAAHVAGLTGRLGLRAGRRRM